MNFIYIPIKLAECLRHMLLIVFSAKDPSTLSIRRLSLIAPKFIVSYAAIMV